MSKKWTFAAAENLFNKPFFELIHQAHKVLKNGFPKNSIQISTLLNIKTGRCPENCSYCPQSAHYNTGLKDEPLMKLEDVIQKAQEAKDVGASRFCLAAAWRGPNDRDLNKVCEMVTEVKKLGLETCVTLGLLENHQAHALKDAGLDYYNHNIDTSPEFYKNIITTRNFEDRIETLKHVTKAGLKVCCGGILGMGETNEDRINMLLVLANLESPPESIPINRLITIPGTPLENAQDIDPFDFVRTIALTRIMMPNAYVRLSGARKKMSDELQALCFYAGANSIFYGKKLLVTTEANPTPENDDLLLNKLSLIAI